ncbi:MAG: cysteine desulfurase NifS [Chitinivibrionales bacterium]|nr:cysteine desulfurase NifS [Chitinivibrionales bacterium]
MKTIYLDNNATTMVAPEVVEAMQPFFGEYYGNPSSIHKFGGSVHKHLDTAREQVASLCNASPSEIFFTSCGSESDNQALKGFVRSRKSRARIITSTVEHPAVLNTCRALREDGVAVSEIPVNEYGMPDMDAFYQADIDSDTLVSFMWANNETGVMFPIREISEYVKSKGGMFHTDAVQAAGKIPLDVQEVPVDILAISGHKLHAPKGVGIIYIRDGISLEPLITGGHQESGMRAGTENVPYIIGLGKACELAKNSLDRDAGHERMLRDKLEKALLKKCPGAKLNGDPGKRLPNTTNISFEFIEGEAVLLLLDEHGISASSGSACTTGSLEPSHVMRAMGIPYTFAHSSIRFSLSRYTTEQEIDTVIEVMPPIVKRLRGLSPFVKE